MALFKLWDILAQIYPKRQIVIDSCIEGISAQPSPACVPFPEQVRQLRVTLNAFIEESEAEFLALGSCLGKLSKVSRKTIGTLETGITLASLGSNGVEEQHLKLTFENLQQTVKSTREATENFGEVAAMIDRLSRMQEALKRTLSSLSFVGLYFSIESVRLPAEQRDGFTNIRSEMAALQQRVIDLLNEQQQSLLLAKDDFNRCMTQTRQSQDRLREQLAARRIQLEQHFADVMCVPPEVKTLQSQLSSELAEITPTISKLISTLQGHDAVRQRLMHVIETLEQMAEAEEKYPGADGFDCFMEQAAAVQRGQMEGIRQTLSMLIHDVRAGFEKLATAVANLAALALSTEQHASPGSEEISPNSITRETQKMCELIAESLLLNEQLESSSSPVESLASQCSTLIAEVALVLKRTALNTQIYAAHSGDCAGLDALGQQARMIADESIHHSVAISEHLQTLLSSARQFRESLNTSNDLHKAQKQSLIECIGTLTSTLEQSRKGMADSIQELKANSAELQAETAAQVNSLHFLDKGLRLIGDVGSTLENCGTRAGLKEETVLDENLARVLEKIRSQYTMQEERTVHDQLTGTGQQAADDDFFFAAEEETPAMVSAEDDNLELF